jgi:hypothetical protein
MGVYFFIRRISALYFKYVICAVHSTKGSFPERQDLRRRLPFDRFYLDLPIYGSNSRLS